MLSRTDCTLKDLCILLVVDRCTKINNSNFTLLYFGISPFSGLSCSLTNGEWGVVFEVDPEMQGSYTNFGNKNFK